MHSGSLFRPERALAVSTTPQRHQHKALNSPYDSRGDRGGWTINAL